MGHLSSEGVIKEFCGILTHSTRALKALHPGHEPPRVDGDLLHREAEAEADGQPPTNGAAAAANPISASGS